MATTRSMAQAPRAVARPARPAYASPLPRRDDPQPPPFALRALQAFVKAADRGPARLRHGRAERRAALGLSHTPDEMQWARRNKIDLMLAGHVHGGQIRFPVIGSVFVPSRYSRKYDCGSFHEPPTLMHVSRGLAGKHPLRYHCRPEATKVVLRAADKEAMEKV